MPGKPEKMATGNLVVSIPDLRTADGGILDISFLHMAYRSVIEVHGPEQTPLLEPVIEFDGEAAPIGQSEWKQEGHWIPTLRLEHRGARITSSVFAPRDHRGFICLMQVSATERVHVRAGWKGSWGRTYHVSNLSKRMGGIRYGGVSSIRGGATYVEYRGATPIFALGFCPLEEMDQELYVRHEPERIIGRHGDGEASARAGQVVCYSLLKEFDMEPGQVKTLALHVGIGLEEVSAVASAVEMRRRGWNLLLEDLQRWLSRHTVQLDDPWFEHMLNLNSLYNYYFSQGITLDTEDLVLLTSRSSRNPGSGAYKDRDAMLWSLPAVLQVDPRQARKMLESAFTLQLRNVGVLSRFIDGIVLEPGFELDHLCAPIHALWLYVRVTGDMSILFDRRIQAGVNLIQQFLSTRRHPKVPLFETTMHPCDGPAGYPYLTYDNVMVWRMLKDLAWMYDRIRDLDRAQDAVDLAEEVRKAILANCVVQGPSGPVFAWAVDLAGNHQLGDEPSGSLQLLSHLEFVPADSPVYRNTVNWIHSTDNPFSFAGCAFEAPGCEGQLHPSLLSVANDLLTGRREQALDLLRRTGLDDGIACETLDENTGRVASGPAFASCAGYLAHALHHALRGERGPVSPTKAEPRPADRLYQPPPPELRDALDGLAP